MWVSDNTNNEISLYVDGILVNTIADTTPTTSNESYFIGGQNNGGSPSVNRSLMSPVYYFKVHKKALIQEEATQAYNDWAGI